MAALQASIAKAKAGTASSNGNGHNGHSGSKSGTHARRKKST
jgi:hypothetical protein